MADTPLDTRNVLAVVRVRRLVCPTPTCHRQTFREQLPGVLARYQRRTPRLAARIGAVVRELAGQAREYCRPRPHGSRRTPRFGR
ncbi:hypothetical protein HNR23_004335 [Nocardiopsis mwathae]|uniref:Transposase n=1 Tax=Nocardiopsis mwathae TaxID=1472723 RepID=A0A7X0D7E7_9ACTN|nr:hypothetical protein [Nocardiopsis mwathae]